MEQMDYNLLFRWFVGLEMDDPVWDVTVFTKNRERLIAGAVSQQLLAAVLVEAREHDLLSEEHFTVDGTLIQAWAAARSFKEKSDPPAPGSRFGPQGRGAFARQGGVDDRPGRTVVQESDGGQGGSRLPGPRADGKPQRVGGGGRGQSGGHGGRARNGAEVTGPEVSRRKTSAMERRSRWEPTRSIRKRSLSRICGSARWLRM